MEREPPAAEDGLNSAAELAAELRMALARSGLSNQQVIGRSGVRKSAYYEAKSGKSLPRAGTLHSILVAARVAADEAERLERARDRIAEQRSERPAIPPSQEQPGTTVPGPPRPPGAWRRSPALRLVAVAVLLVAIAGVGYRLYASRNPFPRLHLLPAPPHPEWSACTSGPVWPTRFDDHYRGEVYALLSPGSPAPAPARLTLTWGDSQWTGDVVIQPGALPHRRGGTLLRFVKKQSIDSDPTDWNPGVRLDSSIPVCAVFGTADSRPLAAPASVVETPGWTTTHQGR